MFITLEGPEGSGKTSHIPYLVEYLREKGHVVFPTREPGGTSIGEQIREVIHDLGARGLVEESLGARMHLHVFQIMDHFPNLLANGRAAWLARGEYDMSLLAEVFHEVRDVRGLA